LRFLALTRYISLKVPFTTMVTISIIGSRSAMDWCQNRWDWSFIGRHYAWNWVIFSGLNLPSLLYPWGSCMQRETRGPWPTQNFGWVGHSAFGPTDN